MTTPTPPPPGAAPAAASQPNGSRKRTGLIAIILVVIAGLAAGAGLVLINQGDDETARSAEQAGYVVMDSPVVEPVFEPKDARGPDPFFPLEVQLVAFQAEQQEAAEETVAAATVDSEEGLVAPVPTPSVLLTGTDDADVQRLDAQVATGLYGGTEENTCDPERLIAFLYANPSLGEAWAQVQGIEFNEIADYIRGLEIRVLAEDVNVLNHGFDPTTGTAYEIDTILAAGTAVLVDEDGNIRTRCYCGNPIKPKPPTGHMPPRCVVYGAKVWITPGGPNERNNVPADRNVLLTGKETTIGAQRWIEVKWGNNDDQKGWVRSGDLKKGYCPRVHEYRCPGPDDVPVYAARNPATIIGALNGLVFKTTETVEIFHPLAVPGAPGGEVIIDGWLLIEFPAPAADSAWVRVDDLDHDDCGQVSQCINTNGPLFDRPHGAPLPGSGGVGEVVFSGRFAGNPINMVELASSPWGSGWILTGYIPLDDADCENDNLPPRCVAESREGIDNVLFADPDPASGAVGFAADTWVKVLDPNPTNGRVLVQLYSHIDGTAPIGTSDGQGLVGWIAESTLVGDAKDCVGQPVCMSTSAPAKTQWPNTGADLGPFTDKTVTIHTQQGATPGGFLELIEVDGRLGWLSFVDVSKIAPVNDPSCRPGGDNPCPGDFVPIDDRYADYDPDNSDVALIQAAGIVTGRGELPQIDPPSLPDIPIPPIAGICCLSGDVHDGPDGGFIRTIDPPEWVAYFDVTTTPTGTWYHLGAGEWINGTVHSADECTRNPAPECPPVLELINVVFIGNDIPQPIDPPTGNTPPIGTGCCVSALFAGPSVTAAEIPLANPVDVGVVTGGPVIDPVSGASFYSAELGGTTVWFPAGARVSNDWCVSTGGCPQTPGDDSFYDYRPAVNEALAFVAQGPTTDCCVDIYAASPGATRMDLIPPRELRFTDSAPLAADGELWYEADLGDGTLVWVPLSGILPAGSDCAPTRCPAPGIIPGLPGTTPVPGDDGDDGELTTSIPGVVPDEPDYAALELVIDPSNDTVPAPECCVSGGLGSEPGDIGPAGGFTSVVLTGSTADVGGVLWHEVDAAGMIGWVPSTAFVDGTNCGDDPTPDCETVPAPQTFTTALPNGGNACCVSHFVGGAPSEGVIRDFSGDGLTWRFTPTGVTETDADGTVWFEGFLDEAIDPPDWPAGPYWASSFVGADECGDEPEGCPEGTVDLQGVCCQEGQQYLNGQCVDPCPPGTNRTNSGDCEPPTPAPQPDPTVTPVPQPDPTVTPVPEPDPDPCPNGVIIQGLCCAEGQVVSQGVCTDACVFQGGDRDSDGVCDPVDNCPSNPNPGQADADRDGLGDECDSADPCADLGGDTDRDGICDELDDCPNDPFNDCGQDPCAPQGDKDSDNDGICDQQDLCPNDPFNQCQVDPCFDLGGDTDGDGVCDQLDYCPGDVDLDNDEICDAQDACPNDPINQCLQSTACGNIGDSDNDGVCDDVDFCPFDPTIGIWTGTTATPICGNELN